MVVEAQFVHTNLVARDWRRLAQFYQEVLGCVPVPPERDLSGPWLEAATGVAGARIQGMHLRLPGWGSDGPTLEIFQYDPQIATSLPAINRRGFGHIAFSVDNVFAAREAVLEAGGGEVGQTVTREIPGAGAITFVYLNDPEGNIIELQRWFSIRDATLCLPVRGGPVRGHPPGEVLLGYKKAGFGAGKRTGFGGKVEAGETVRAAAARELEEETGLRASQEDLREAGVLTFLFPFRPSWSQRVAVYLLSSWSGKAREGREMRPEWFRVENLPLGTMWQDGAHWLPRILAGEKLRATYVFGGDNETIDEISVEPFGPPQGARE